MASLSAFLNPVVPDEEEIIISKRFQENGKPVPFKIRPLTQEENQALIKQCSESKKGPRGTERRLNADRYSAALIVAATVEPDFRNAELCKAYGTMDPLQVPAKMLLAGEHQKLSEAILALSGISDDEEAEEEVKN